MSNFVIKEGRLNKAKKIESVLSNFLNKNICGYKILDIGCGTGEIIDYFKTDNTVYAVDMLNQIKKGIKIKNFNIVDSAVLPFKNNYFDVIISNHVVEHIEDQDTHMREIFRCLKPGSICYYATPNKNYFLEPHHRIPFIHYFGQNIFHKILKWLNLYEEDIYLLSHKNMKSSFHKHKFKYYEYTAKVIKNPDYFNLKSRVFKNIPLPILNVLQVIIPTNIFIIMKD